MLSLFDKVADGVGAAFKETVNILKDDKNDEAFGPGPGSASKTLTFNRQSSNL